MGVRVSTAPHHEDCDSLDCPCYRNGQSDLLLALRTLRKMGLTEAFEQMLKDPTTDRHDEQEGTA